jgi:pilus assembly protein FimV
VRVKLLEIYSNRKDLRAFEVMATELYGLTKGEGDEWVQAALLGIAIDPNNPLYALGKTTKAVNTATETPIASQIMGEQGLTTLLTTTTQHPSVQSETIDPLETDTSYFSNTDFEAEPAAVQFNPAQNEQLTDALPSHEAAPTDEITAMSSLDFDLGNINIQEIEAPNAIPHPETSEPNVDIGSIDFDFLDKPKVAADPMPAEAGLSFVSENGNKKSAAENLNMALPAIAVESATDEIAPMDFGLSFISEEPAPELSKGESKAGTDSLDFDLSDINLELGPETSDAIAGMSDSGVLSLSDAEMATKLDLAIAYQEIGDKEGARELLDEVLKGGTPEQSEKAKSLLLELA